MSSDRLAEIEAWVRDGNFAPARDVLALVEIAKQMQDFAGHGTRFDTNPTVMIHGDNPEWLASHQWWVSRADAMDKAIRQRARAALDRLGSQPQETA